MAIQRSHELTQHIDFKKIGIFLSVGSLLASTKEYFFSQQPSEKSDLYRLGYQAGYQCAKLDKLMQDIDERKKQLQQEISSHNLTKAERDELKNKLDLLTQKYDALKNEVSQQQQATESHSTEATSNIRSRL